MISKDIIHMRVILYFTDRKSCINFYLDPGCIIYRNWIVCFPKSTIFLFYLYQNVFLKYIKNLGFIKSFLSVIYKIPLIHTYPPSYIYSSGGEGGGMKRGNFRYLQICYVKSRKLQSLLPFNEGNLPFRAWGPGGRWLCNDSPFLYTPCPSSGPRGEYMLYSI